MKKRISATIDEKTEKIIKEILNKGNFRKSNLKNMSRSNHSKLHAKKRSSWW